MAHYLPVMPPHFIDSLQTKTMNKLFLLAHEVVKAPEEYETRRDYWSGYHRTCFSILDNSLCELGNAVDFAMVKEAAEISRPHVVVLPDAYEKAEETIEVCCSAMGQWTWETKRDTMIVPQGETLGDWIRCLELLMDFRETLSDAVKPRVCWIGIPRNTPGRIISSRYKLAELVHAMYPNMKIHLLGFSDMMHDDIISARHPAVRSIDSAVPIRVPWKFSVVSNPGPRGDWWEKGEVGDYSESNMHMISRMVSV